MEELMEGLEGLEGLEGVLDLEYHQFMVIDVSNLPELTQNRFVLQLDKIPSRCRQKNSSPLYNPFNQIYSAIS